MTIFLTKIGPIRTALKVCVLHDVHRILERTGSKIHGVQRLRSNLLRPLQVLIVPYVVWNKLIPCGIEVNLSLVLRSDGILPLPCRHKVTAGQTARRHPRPLQATNEVRAESLLIRRRMLRIIHRTIHHGPDRLQERTKEPRRDLTNLKRRMHCNFRCFCHTTTSQSYFSFSIFFVFFFPCVRLRKLSCVEISVCFRGGCGQNTR